MWDYIYGSMVECTTAIGMKTKCMAKENIIIKMAENMWEIMLSTRGKDKANIICLMEIELKEPG